MTQKINKKKLTRKMIKPKIKFRQTIKTQNHLNLYTNLPMTYLIISQINNSKMTFQKLLSIYMMKKKKIMAIVG